MPRSIRAGCLLLLAPLCLAGCGISQPQVAASSPISVAVPGVGTARISDFFQSLLAQSRDLGSVAPSMRVSLIVLLKDPYAAQRAAALAAMYRPGSPTFGKYETVKDLERFSPPLAMVTKVRDALSAEGVSSGWHRSDTWMTLTGPARAVAQQFGVQIDNYISPKGEHFYASLRDPVIPSDLRFALTGAGHVSSYVTVRKQRTIRAVPSDGLSPTGLRLAYDMTPLTDQLRLNGAGQTVAFVEVDGFNQSDLNTFTTRFGLPAMQPTIKFGPTLKPGDETEMDLQVVHEIAPLAKLTVYNCPGSCNDPDLIRAIAAAVRDTPHGIISISLGGCESDSNAAQIQAMNSPFDQADALGESVFISSGDSGAFTCLTDNWGAAPTNRYIGASSPATAPGVTSVGGTRISVGKDGTWYREEVWENPAETEASGGGPSLFVPRPAWQTGPGVDLKSKRQTPDVSADADPQTGATLKFVEGWFQGGGTSQAAPIWAGMAALMNQYLNSHGMNTLGFLNPALYAIAKGAPQFPAFHDVTIGTNLVNPAGPGYDMASGLGTPDAWNLMRDLQTYMKTGKP
jgi:kumamolisin